MAASEISDLIARATALLNRAQRLANTAIQPSLNNQITVIAATLRDTHVELRRMLSGESVSRPAGPRATLDAQAAKLDVLEDRLAH